ncbi:MAG TPA: flagellar protein FlaG [Candidatus Acidoferrales bacterium]|jgi:flagellar protein FlaG|nr:flagellar protein FlaG [Candidatus Acidoferrales bacterium]
MDITAVSRSMPASVGSVPDVPVQKAQENRDIVKAVRALNGAESFGQDNHLSFQRDPYSHQMVLRVVNQKSGDVVLQLPSEEALRMAEDLKRLQADASPDNRR